MTPETTPSIDDNSDTFDKILTSTNKELGWEDFFNPINKTEDKEKKAQDSEQDEQYEYDENIHSDSELKQSSPKKRLSQNERLKKQLHEERARNQDLINRLQQTEYYNHSLTHNSLTQQYNNLDEKEKYWSVIKDDYKNALAGAYEGGSATSVAEAADRMQIANLELERLKNEKDKIINQIDQVKNYQPSQYQESNNKEYDNNLNEFLDKYPFLSPNENNPNYAPDAVAKVSKISSDLATEYKLEGRGYEIRSKEYFQELENRMSKELYNNSKTSPQSISRSARMVAPVGKRNTITHDEPDVRFSSNDKILMMNLRNEFGTQYDDLLKKKFIENKKNNQSYDDSIF